MKFWTMSSEPQLTLPEGTAVVGAVGFGGVRHEVVGSATAVAPDVAEVEPVAHLVGGRTAEVVRTGAGAVERRTNW